MRQEILEMKESPLFKGYEAVGGILDRKHFYENAYRIIREADLKAVPLVFVFCNIENFKSYNKTYGFKAGNELLEQLSAAFLLEFRSDPVAHLGSDQFLILTERREAEEHLREISGLISMLRGKVRLSLKAGISCIQETAPENLQLFEDSARIASNSISRRSDRFCAYYDEKLEQSYTLRQHIIDSLDEAMTEGRIRLVLQPIVYADTGCVASYEALSRWDDPVYGSISPADYIPVLEDYRLICRLDLYIAEEVLKLLRQAEKSGHKRCPVSFNISQWDFTCCDIVGEIDSLLKKYRTPAGLLSIELTESVLTGDVAFLKQQIDRFHSIGCQVFMDDFGSGYSSLNVLKNYDFDMVKIDMEFLKSFDQRAKTVINHTIAMISALGMRTLAEGVENADQVSFLRRCGCELLQGYLFDSEPVPTCCSR